MRITKELCLSCYYWDRSAKCCSFLYDEGKRRMLIEGNTKEECTVYREGTKKHGENWHRRGMGNYKR